MRLHWRDRLESIAAVLSGLCREASNEARDSKNHAHAPKLISGQPPFSISGQLGIHYIEGQGCLIKSSAVQKALNHAIAVNKLFG